MADSGYGPLKVWLMRSLMPAVLVAAVFLLRCAPSIPTEAVVRRAVDGDTVQLSDGRFVRYLGIDTPEVRRKQSGAWIEDPEPYGLEASRRNHELVAGNRIRLEYDIETHDRFGRLLAYVYADGKMVNETLLREGLAEPMILRPQMRYADRFRELAEQARRNRLGLWSAD